MVVAVDVGNPFVGQNGATFVFGPQKGADANALGILFYFILFHFISFHFISFFSNNQNSPLFFLQLQKNSKKACTPFLPTTPNSPPLSLPLPLPPPSPLPSPDLEPQGDCQGGSLLLVVRKKGELILFLLFYFWRRG